MARAPVCACHQPPWEAVRCWIAERPAVVLLLGPRGGGKSFLRGLAIHWDSRWRPGHRTKVLGGSKQQSMQIYNALKDTVLKGGGPLGSDRDALKRLLVEGAEYENGSEVSILAASSTAVRGPHVPELCLDEVDEIDPSIREDALGMCMADGRGNPATISMTSTWHRVGGPMAGLIDRGKAGEFPFYAFCAFEVLERCPEARSGPALENCPACPLFDYCHSERFLDPSRPPKAKLSDGHYAIDSLIQKAKLAARRTFEADYLCLGPKADGVWFPDFHRRTHVGADAEYDPRWPVHAAVDSGVYTGAVLFQIGEAYHDGRTWPEVRIFGDYLAEGRTAYAAAGDVLELARTLCNGRLDVRSTDPAGGSRNAIGPTVLAEYLRAGLRADPWPAGSVADGLALIDSFLRPAAGPVRLRIHPRCGHMIDAFENYRRASKAGQWLDKPEDPQHPHEDVMDALRGGLRNAYPEGRVPEPQLTFVRGSRLF